MLQVLKKTVRPSIAQNVEQFKQQNFSDKQDKDSIDEALLDNFSDYFSSKIDDENV